jgi:N-acyl-D-amino-acid deacylase
MQFDLVLQRGSLLDGTGADARSADVAVLGDRVAAIAPPGSLRGALTLDCAGLTVCPSFLDTHSHSDLAVLRAPALDMKAHQGVGLDVVGQDGIGVAPLHEAQRSTMARTIAGLDGTLEDWDWEGVDGYFQRVERARPGIHIAALVPHGNIRLNAMGPDDRPATAAELQAMERFLEEGLEQGAVGLSTGLIYPPCCYAPTEELIALGRVLARHDRPVVVHLRSESDYLIEAVDEMLRVGRESGCRVHISHLKIAGRDNWGKVDALLHAFDRAAAEGIALTADQYPYTAGSTMMGAILPPWAHDGGPDATLQRLDDPDARARIEAALRAPGPHAWDNFWGWADAAGIFVSSLPEGFRPELVGRSVAEGAALDGQSDRPIPWALDLLRDARLGVGMIAFSQGEAVVAALAAHPRVNGCTDGLLGGKPHPRAYGAFPRVLGRLVREQGVCTLPEAVRKLTSQAADALTLKGRGRVVEGGPADLVAFDAAAILDRATYADPRQYPVGLPHVVVGGALTVRDGGATGARGGQVVRG